MMVFYIIYIAWLQNNAYKCIFYSVRLKTACIASYTIIWDQSVILMKDMATWASPVMQYTSVEIQVIQLYVPSALIILLCMYPSSIIHHPTVCTHPLSFTTPLYVSIPYHSTPHCMYKPLSFTPLIVST